MIDNFQTVLHLANELQIMIIIWALHGVPYFIIQSYDDDDDDDDYSSWKSEEIPFFQSEKLYTTSHSRDSNPRPDQYLGPSTVSCPLGQEKSSTPRGTVREVYEFLFSRSHK